MHVSLATFQWNKIRNRLEKQYLYGGTYVGVSLGDPATQEEFTALKVPPGSDNTLGKRQEWNELLHMFNYFFMKGNPGPPSPSSPPPPPLPSSGWNILDELEGPFPFDEFLHDD
ncbi:hypothetical protein BDP27DRAFT_1361744 [Rhodocollybia butyracea]|uniref:Uncharacterized protein n=1 Tax=Rhodocollybia butyracea TaxID=206335 RepID=A0A9P5Q0X0_9AGAR|nr:hypothetical protein BDP27DRAFT_1361744 [Rhodocollybia butyracea]